MSTLTWPTVADEPLDRRDPLHHPSPEGCHWTRANVAEALPGVLTPLGWTVWRYGAERAIRTSFYRIGVFSRGEERPPDDPARDLVSIFHGRPATRLDVMCTVGDRLPGTSGPEVLESVFAGSPDDFEFQPTRRRYPAIALRMPWIFLTNPRRLRRARRQTERWWRASVEAVGGLDLPAATAAFDEAVERFRENILLQSVTLFACVQPVYDALARASEAVGGDSAAELTGGYGGVPEAEVVSDLWLASRGELAFDAVVARHGYHGPWEGEISGRVWREDPTPLRAISEASDIARYVKPGVI